MNTRSLKFRLVVWYAGLLLVCLTLLGIGSYLVLRSSLVGALKENQLRRARQIAQLLQDEIRHQQQPKVGEEVEARYAPGTNDRFVRITQRDGTLVYLSSPPKSQGFNPVEVPAPEWPAVPEMANQVLLSEDRKMVLARHVLQAPGGAGFLIEAGAPTQDLESDLKKWRALLLWTLPLVAAIAVGGGYVLVSRSLSPVDRIAASAERISSHNLSERLPVPKTGDELERLSEALNHMIERLDLAFQYSRRFVADASHELRTPLTVLRGELESYVQDRASTPEWRERLGSALEEVERLSNIVEGLFAISRLDAGEAAAEWVKFDLSAMAAGTADQMALLAEDKSIEVTCRPTSCVWVEGDRARLKQVVVNLLDNAIKYTPEGGSVVLSVASEGHNAVLEVADTGIGIPADAVPKVFERFFRVDKARSREQGGAGLGLSIVKSICTAHHGRVDVSSTPGQGSRFKVELPLASTPTNHHKLPENREH